ncbi:MAG: hypothetical protein HY521_03715 [Proteobacteria bacterium]|nr:hypothetical protein [Pseudomonadota bacterium]
MNAAARVRNFHDIGSRLAALIEVENGLLAAMRAREIKDLQPEKSRLVRALEEAHQSLQGTAGAFAAADSRLLGEVAELVRRLETLSEENVGRLTAASEANRRLFEAIVEAVRTKRAQGSSYSRTGTTAQGTSGNGQPISMALDRRL